MNSGQQQFCDVFVTYIDKEGPLLKVWAQIDRTAATFVERLILQYAEQFERGAGVPHPSTLSVGQLCCAKYGGDGVYYRAKITSLTNMAQGQAVVHFIDYGNCETVTIDNMRSLSVFPSSPLSTVIEQASEFYLAGVVPMAGEWDTNSLAYIREKLCYGELKCTIVAHIHTKKLLTIYFENADFSQHLIEKKIGVSIALTAQEVLMKGLYGWTAPQDIKYVMPPPIMTPSIPRSVGLQPNMQFNMANPRTNGTLLHLPRPMVHLPEQPQVFSVPVLDVNSEHNVYVSYVEDGPSSFAVQLQNAENTLNILSTGLNALTPQPLTQPLMPGSVCLGRFTEINRSMLCRAVVVSVKDSDCKVYCVDFGNSKDIPYSNIFELPPQFMNHKGMALRFALAGIRHLPLDEEAKMMFENFVTDKLLILRVVAPEGPPIKQFGELFYMGKNIKDILLEKIKSKQLKQCYPKIPAPPVGDVMDVTISFVDTVTNFYVQLESNAETLTAIMGCVESHCTRAAPVLEASQLSSGMPCCALYSADDVWYRAKVMALLEDSASVLYVDYGNTDMTHIGSLRQIETNLAKMQVQAVACCLEGFRDRERVEAESVRLEEITLEKVLSMKVVDVLPTGVLVVELHDTSVQPAVNIAAQLMDDRSPVAEIKHLNEWQRNCVTTDTTREKHTSNIGCTRDRTNSRCSSDGGTDWQQKKSNWRESRGEHGAGKFGRHEDRGVEKRWNDREDRFGDEKQFGNRNDGDGGEKKWGNKDDRFGGEKKFSNREERFGNEGKFGNRDDGNDSRRKWGNRDDGNGEKKWGNREDKFSCEKRFGNRDDKFGGDKKFGKRDDRFGGERKLGSQDGRLANEKKWGNHDNVDGEMKWGKNCDGDKGDRKWENKDSAKDKGERKFGGNYDRGDYGFNSWKDNEGRDFKQKNRNTDSDGRSQANWNKTREQQSVTNIWQGKTSSEIFPEATVLLGTTQDVELVYAASPVDFTVQVTSGNSELQSMMERIASIYVNGGSVLEKSLLQCGTPCVARYTDDTWYRAVVESSDGATVKVHFVDYGNHEEISPADVKKINPEFLSTSILGIRCSLLCSRPLSGKWTTEELTNFLDLTDVQLLRARFVQRKEKVIEVVLENVETSAVINENFGATNSELKAAIVSPPRSKVVNAANLIFASPDQQYPEQPLKLGLNETVSVTWFVTPSEFYCQFLSSYQAFKDMITDIQGSHQQRTPLKTVPAVGTVVIARFPDDGVLYRGEVIEQKGTTHCDVRYVDYGNVETLSAGDLWQVEMRFMQLPKQSVLCTLAGVTPVGGSWPRSAPEIDQLFGAEQLACTFHEVIDGQYSVSLTHDGKSVAAELLANGLAVELQIGSQQEEQADEVPLDLELCQGQRLAAHVTYIESISKFFVQLEPICALEVQTAVDQHVQSLESTLVFPAEQLLKHSLCLATPDGTHWYRGMILDVTRTIGTNVFFMDLGYCDEISLDKMQGIPSVLAGPRRQAMECLLSGSEGIQVSAELEEQFKLEVEDQDVILLVEGVANGRLSVRLFDVEGQRLELIKSIGDGSLLEVEPVCPFPMLASHAHMCVSHIESPSSIWLQRTEDITTVLPDLLEKMFTFYEMQGERLSSPEEGKLCAAQSSDGNWYRVKVTAVVGEEVRVAFIDYGNGETVQVGSIKELDASFFSPHALSVCVSLAVNTDNPQACTIYLTENAIEKEFDINFVKGNSGMWWANITDGISSLTQQLIEQGLATEMTDSPFHSTSLVEKSSLLTQNECYPVIVSHPRSPSEFWIQLESNVDRINSLQSKLQNIGASAKDYTMPPVIGTLCIAMFTEDNEWYRALVLECNSTSCNVCFVDYGNEDSVSLGCGKLKVLSADFVNLPYYAIKCSLLATPVSGSDWNIETTERFEELILTAEEPVLIEVLDIGEPVMVKLILKDIDIMRVLIDEGLATELSPGMKEIVISHVNSLNEFWIQYESSTLQLDIIADKLVNADNFKPLLESFDGALCAALFSEDEMWYRARVLESTSEGTHVLYIDYGNTAISTELRILPKDLVQLPPVANHCTLQLPDSITKWPKEAEEKFVQMTKAGAATFQMKILLDGDPTVIDLLLNGKDVTQTLVGSHGQQDVQSNTKKILPVIVENIQHKVIESVSDYYKINDNDVTQTLAGINGQQDVQSNTNTILPVIVENIQHKIIASVSDYSKILISHVNSPNEFWIQYESSLPQLDEIIDKLTNAESFAPFHGAVNGALCAALFSEDEQWYRAKLIEFREDCSEVLYIDYGNTASSTELRTLPVNLIDLPPMAKRCSLLLPHNVKECYKEADNMLVELAEAGTKTFQMKLLLDGDPAVISLFQGDMDVAQILEASCKQQKAQPSIKNVTQPLAANCRQDEVQTNINESTILISHVNSPNEFWVQYESSSSQLDEITDRLTDADSFEPFSEAVDGALCVALFPEDEQWYRAKIVSCREHDIEVFFIDYGNSSSSTDLQALPDDLLQIPPLAKCCRLTVPDGLNMWPEVAEKEFVEIFGDGTKVFELTIIQDDDPAIVSLIHNGIKVENQLLRKVDEQNLPLTLNANIPEKISSSNMKLVDVPFTVIDSDNIVSLKDHEESATSILEAKESVQQSIEMIIYAEVTVEKETVKISTSADDPLTKEISTIEKASTEAPMTEKYIHEELLKETGALKTDVGNQENTTEKVQSPNSSICEATEAHLLQGEDDLQLVFSNALHVADIVREKHEPVLCTSNVQESLTIAYSAQTPCSSESSNNEKQEENIKQSSRVPDFSELNSNVIKKDSAEMFSQTPYTCESTNIETRDDIDSLQNFFVSRTSNSKIQTDIDLSFQKHSTIKPSSVETEGNFEEYSPQNRGACNPINIKMHEKLSLVPEDSTMFKINSQDIKATELQLKTDIFEMASSEIIKTETFVLEEIDNSNTVCNKNEEIVETKLLMESDNLECGCTNEQDTEKTGTNNCGNEDEVQLNSIKVNPTVIQNITKSVEGASVGTLQNHTFKIEHSEHIMKDLYVELKMPGTDSDASSTLLSEKHIFNDISKHPISEPTTPRHIGSEVVKTHSHHSSSPRLCHSDRIVPGSISRGTSQEDEVGLDVIHSEPSGKSGLSSTVCKADEESETVSHNSDEN